MKYLIVFMSLFCVTFSAEYPRLKSLTEEEEQAFICKMNILQDCIIRLHTLIYSCEFPYEEDTQEKYINMKNEIDQCMYLIGVKKLMFID